MDQTSSSVRKRRVVQFAWAAGAGSLLSSVCYLLSMVSSRGASIHLALPEEAIFCPGGWYIFAWPAFFPLAIHRHWAVKRFVRYLVLMQMAAVSVTAFRGAELSALKSRISAGGATAAAVILMIVLYYMANIILFCMAALGLHYRGPRRT